MDRPCLCVQTHDLFDGRLVARDTITAILDQLLDQLGARGLSSISTTVASNGLCCSRTTLLANPHMRIPLQTSFANSPKRTCDHHRLQEKHECLWRRSVSAQSTLHHPSCHLRGGRPSSLRRCAPTQIGPPLGAMRAQPTCSPKSRTRRTNSCGSSKLICAGLDQAWCLCSRFGLAENVEISALGHLRR